MVSFAVQESCGRLHGEAFLFSEDLALVFIALPPLLCSNPEKTRHTSSACSLELISNSWRDGGQRVEDSPVCRLLSKMLRPPLVFSGKGSYRSITSAAEIVEVSDGGDLSSSCAFTSCSRALASQRLNH